MHKASTKRFCITFLLVFFINISFGQTSLYGLTDEAVFRNDTLKPTVIKKELSGRYDYLPDDSIERKYSLAKYISRTEHRIGNVRDISRWHHMVDSLGKLLDSPDFDPYYMLHIAGFHLTQKDPNNALRVLNNIKSDIFAGNDTSLIISWHSKMVRTFNTIDDRAIALDHLLVLENINRELDDQKLEALIYRLHGDLHWEERELEQTYSQYLKSAELYETLNDKDALLPLYTNLMSIAQNIGAREAALEYADKLSSLQSSHGSEVGYFTTEVNKIFFLIQMGRYNRARDQAFKTIALADSMKTDKSHAIYLLGVSYRGLDQYDLAEKYIEEAFNMGLEINHYGKCAFYAHALYETYYWKDKFEPALEWYIKHTEFRDSVFNERKAGEIAVLEAKFEALEKEKTIDKLEAKAALDEEKNRNLWFVILLGSLLGAITIYGQRQKSMKEKIQHRFQMEKLRLENEKLERELEFKKKELSAQILYITQKNSSLKEVESNLYGLKTEGNRSMIDRISRIIKRELDNEDNWSSFLNSFKSIHSSFLEKLNSLSDNLTTTEIRLASLLKINLSSKEIASMLNISTDGVKKARYRLRKKLGINSDINIQNYLLHL